MSALRLTEDELTPNNNEAILLSYRLIGKQIKKLKKIRKDLKLILKPNGKKNDRNQQMGKTMVPKIGTKA